MPPPLDALFATIVLFTIWGDEDVQYIPPPSEALFAAMMLFAITGEEFEQ